MAKTTPVLFFKQVRQEIAKVTWPTRRETLISTAMVFVMVMITAIFFFVVDQFFATTVKVLFGLGG
ncbi:preprotein translocase subunit SecE [Phaeospirillum tilakii]|uniref:Protein translocase subunit SecE n=1 Tax=Phaeospirillum tilakii TaxID=741673 RepID=A0ABW5CH59_9PROT